MKLVATVYGDDDDQKSFQEAQGLLQAYPDLKAHHLADHRRHRRRGPLPVSSSAYKGKVQLTGLGTPNQMREFVKDGTVTEFALWNPADLGYLAALRRRRAGLRPDHRRGGREVQGRQARRATPSARTARSSSARRPSFNAANIDQFNF